MDTPTTDQRFDNLGLAKYDSGKAPPTTRLKDATKAQQLAQKLVFNNQERSRKNAILKGQIDGNRPFKPSALRAAGQAWRTNVNFGEAKAAVSAALTPFYDLFTGSKYFFRIETKFGDNVREQALLSDAITEEADYHVREWDGFDFNMQAMLFEMIAFGKGFLYWLDKSDWRFEWLAQHLVYVPDNTKAFSSKLPVVAVRGEYQVHELYGLISGKSASDAGWNVPFAKLAIEQAYSPNRANNNGNSDYEAIQQKIKDNDIYEGMEASKIPVSHIFLAEFDGSVTHLIVPENPLRSDGNNEKGIDFIYQAVSEFKSFNRLIATFFFETLDGSWNGANGLAKDIFEAIELKNRLKCNVCDGAFLSSSIVMQAQDANALEKVNLIQIGPFSIIPPGFAVQQSTVMGNLQGPMAADRMLESTISSNTGIYRPKMDKPDGNPRTAREVELNFQAGATLSNSGVNRFYLNLDRLYTELVRRLVLDEDFRTRCKERGIPVEALKQIRCVRAHRAVGNGSSFMRQQAMTRIAPLVPLMTEQGRLDWARDSVAAETNQYTAQRYFSDPDADVAKTDQAALATLENTVLKIGGPVQWTPSQSDVIHAQTHLQFAAAAAASLQQGGNPIEVLNTIDNVGAHVVVHRQHMTNDEFRGETLKAIDAQMKQLAGVADKLRQGIKQQAQQAQEQQQQNQQADAVQQGIDPDTRIKAARAAQDMKIKSDKANLANQIKIESHQVKTALADAKTASDISRQTAAAKADQLAQTQTE